MKRWIIFLVVTAVVVVAWMLVGRATDIAPKEQPADTTVSDPVVREEMFELLEKLGVSRGDEETRGYDTQIYFLTRK